jgi:hypothetical protein
MLKEITITGNQADQYKMLVNFKHSGDDSKSYIYFDSYLDVFLAAGVLGYINDCKGNSDNESNADPITIPQKTLLGSSDAKRLMNLIAILDCKDMDAIEMLRVAFEDDHISTEGKPQKQQIFEEYAAAGIGILHEKITKDANAREDYLFNLYNFIVEDLGDVVTDNAIIGDILGM